MPHGDRLACFYTPREDHASGAGRVVQSAQDKVRARSHTVNTLLTVMPGAPKLSTPNCGRHLEDVLVSRRANPCCRAQFKYLHEGRLFQFSSVTAPAGINKGHSNFAFWWLCPRCSSSMTLIQNGPTDAKLVRLSDVADGSLRQ
jgi:hypothetical protein